jgi:hypothetical protein
MPDTSYSPEWIGYLKAPGPAPTRRSMLRTAAGAGAAGLVASAALGAVTAPTAAAATRPAAGGGPARAHGPGRAAPSQSREPIVVHVRDLSTGEMDIFAGTSQTRRHDRALAAALARAVR